MQKTATPKAGIGYIAVDIDTLQGMLDCGKATARQIGDDAGARIQIGKRVLYLVDKVKTYLNDLADEQRNCEAENRDGTDMQ